MASDFRKVIVPLGCALLLSMPVPLMAQPAGAGASDTARSGPNREAPWYGEFAPGPLLNTASPSDARWRQITGAEAYGYRDKLEQEPVKEPTEDDPWLIRFLERVFRFLGSGTGRLLLWLIFFGILALIAWRILRGQAGSLFARRNRRLPAEVAAQETLSTEGLLESDWEGRMQQALAAGDHRSAIRFGYLRLLQLLQEASLISYRPDKTNRDYQRELQGKTPAAAFRGLTRQYEYAWFGHALPDAEATDHFLKSLQGLKQSIGAA